MENHKLKLILASSSPRRKELLGHLGIPFDIQVKEIPEESDEVDPVKYSSEIARIKNKVISLGSIDDALIISADTIVCLDKKIYTKPLNKEDARRILGELSGKTHHVYTAVCICLKKNKNVVFHEFVEKTAVTFNDISSELMEKYLSTGDSLDKAGAYGIQGPSLTFISSLEGDYANVVGFPLSRFIQECELFLKPYTDGASWFDLF